MFDSVRSTALSRPAFGVGLVLTGLSLLIIGLRWTSSANPVVIALVGLTPYLIAPLVLAAAAAVLGGDRILYGLLAVAVVAYTLTVSPWDAVIGCGSDPDAEADLTLLTMNTYLGNTDPAFIASLVDEHEPDVIVLEETTPALVEALVGDDRMAPYLVRSDTVLTDVVGVIMFSSHPVEGLRKFETERRSTPQALVLAPVGEFMVTAVHTPAPTNGGFAARWRQQFVDLRTIPTDEPHVLMGDFNATEDHGVFRGLLSEGWTDVHQPKGCGLDATWPIGRGLPFPIYRLDHVLVTDSFDVIGVEVIDETGGSDHRAVVARLDLVDRG